MGRRRRRRGNVIAERAVSRAAAGRLTRRHKHFPATQRHIALALGQLLGPVNLIYR